MTGRHVIEIVGYGPGADWDLIEAAMQRVDIAMWTFACRIEYGAERQAPEWVDLGGEG
jgi:hypothetical protein